MPLQRVGDAEGLGVSSVLGGKGSSHRRLGLNFYFRCYLLRCMIFSLLWNTVGKRKICLEQLKSVHYGIVIIRAWLNVVVKILNKTEEESAVSTLGRTLAAHKAGCFCIYSMSRH